MSAKERADLIAKLYKFVKKDCQLIVPPANRNVMEHMLYACCLEDSTNEAADDAFAKLQENYFDWNEVRVTTTAELAETMKGLSQPQQGATRIKKTLQGIFETYYQFDLDFLKKENLSKAVTQFEKLRGFSPFVISYVAQHGLNGHSIPLDRSMLLLFYSLGIASEAEVAKARVPGLERSISKANGIEFSSLAHQLAVAYASSPFNAKIRDKLLKINKDAKDRFPKRASRKKKEEPKPAAKVAEKEVAKKETPNKAATKKTTAKKAAAKKTTVKKVATKKVATKKSPTKKVAKKKATKKVVVKKGSTKKKASKSAKKKLPTKKASRTKSPANRRLAKKKPR